MKIVDCFLFSEPHEKNNLLVKLISENELISEWVAIQSPWDFRGNWKGTFLENILKENEFSNFRDRIKIITINDNLFEKVGKEHCEKGYFQVEHHSRIACVDYIVDKYDDTTRVFISDTDEFADFSNAKKRDRFLEICKQTDKDIQLFQLKFWWNWNNLSCYDKYMPVRTIGSIKQNGLPYFRNDHCQIIKEELVIAIEHSYCFDLEGNIRKTSTFSHDKYRQEHLEKAFFFNAWHKRDHEQLYQAFDFFETIELNDNNSTQYILENFDRLDTKTINPDYAANRQRMLGMSYPHPCEANGMLGNNRIDRRFHFMRRKK